MKSKSDRFNDAQNALRDVFLARQAVVDAQVFIDLAAVPSPDGTQLNSKYSSLQLQRRRRDDQTGERATVAPSTLNSAVLRYVRDNEDTIMAAAMADLREEAAKAEVALAEALTAFEAK
jgi:hypothetical protein